LAHGRQETYEIDSNSKPRRAQGGKGLLSHSISIQSLKNPWLKHSIPREEKGGGRKRGRGAWEERSPKRKRQHLLLPSSPF